MSALYSIPDPRSTESTKQTIQLKQTVATKYKNNTDRLALDFDSTKNPAKYNSS